MAEENKSPTNLNLESEVSSEIDLEIPPVINQPEPISNNRQLEEPEDTTVEDTPKNVGTPQSPLLVSDPSSQDIEYGQEYRQDRHSLPTYLGFEIPESQKRISLPIFSSILTSIDQDVQPFPTEIISKAEVSLSSENSKNEKAGTNAEICQMTERPKSVSSSNTEKPEETLQDTTSPNLIDNVITTETINPDDCLLFLPINQQALGIQTDTTTNPSPSTSKSEFPQQMDEYHELVDQIQRLGLEVTEKSSKDSPNDPFEKQQVSSKRYEDQTWDLPCRERKTGLVTIWNEPDEDFVPYLGIRKAMLAKSKKSGESKQKVRCPQCQRPISGDSSVTCQKCVEENEGALGACGGVPSNPYPYVEEETSPPTEEESSSSDDNFKKPITRMSSFERYVYTRHRQREGLPPYDKPQLQEAAIDYNQNEDSFSSFESGDSEEYHRRMLRQEFIGPRPASQEEISYVMSHKESAIFASLSRPGETVEDLRDPENELREIEHYDRCMAKLNADLLKKDEESDCESEETEYSEESVPSESTTSTSTD